MHGSGLELMLVFLLAAVIAVPVFKRFGLGAVLAYLVAGVVLGPDGLALVRDAAGRMTPGARIVARAENRPPEEVALHLTLPPGAEPAGEAAQLLAEAASATGGRIERAEGGIALVWPRVIS